MSNYFIFYNAHKLIVGYNWTSCGFIILHIAFSDIFFLNAWKKIRNAPDIMSINWNVIMYVSTFIFYMTVSWLLWWNCHWTNHLILKSYNTVFVLFERKKIVNKKFTSFFFIWLLALPYRNHFPLLERRKEGTWSTVA